VVTAQRDQAKDIIETRRFDSSSPTCVCGISGLELLTRLQEKLARHACILMTAYRSVEHAVTAMRLGHTTT